MPPPDSIIPSSEPTELAVAIARTEAIRAGTPLRAFRPSVPETTRGWVSDTKQLTLTEVNHILTEAMSLCGADILTRNVVFAAVELANQGIKNEFA
jgi:hypothetical protein